MSHIPRQILQELKDFAYGNRLSYPGDPNDLFDHKGIPVQILKDLIEASEKYRDFDKSRQPTNFADICVCGHMRYHHIYHEGACRPGFVCSDGCGEFKIFKSKPPEPKSPADQLRDEIQIIAINVAAGVEPAALAKLTAAIHVMIGRLENWQKIGEACSRGAPAYDHGLAAEITIHTVLGILKGKGSLKGEK